MEKQVGLGELLQTGTKATRKQKFLSDMEKIVPLCGSASDTAAGIKTTAFSTFCSRLQTC